VWKKKKKIKNRAWTEKLGGEKSKWLSKVLGVTGCGLVEADGVRVRLGLDKVWQ
jgi:hypothetical protein